ncbi:MAG: hypothetical protein L3J00_01800 [Thiomicrorhabdus sp.]|nr:hypothetical protein [Thiomicrorhabdus sp.]
MFNLKKTIALTTGLLLAVLSGCELTGNIKEIKGDGTLKWGFQIKNKSFL